MKSWKIKVCDRLAFHIHVEMHLVHFIYNSNLKLDTILRKQLCSILFLRVSDKDENRMIAGLDWLMTTNGIKF